MSGWWVVVGVWFYYDDVKEECRMSQERVTGLFVLYMLFHPSILSSLLLTRLYL